MGKVSFLVNGQRMQLEDTVYVLTVSYRENRKNRVVPTKDRCIVKGCLDSLKFSVGFNHKVICTGTALCQIPAMRTDSSGVEEITRIVDFQEADVSLTREILERRLAFLEKKDGGNETKSVNQEE